MAGFRSPSTILRMHNPSTIRHDRVLMYTYIQDAVQSLIGHSFGSSKGIPIFKINSAVEFIIQL